MENSLDRAAVKNANQRCQNYCRQMNKTVRENIQVCMKNCLKSILNEPSIILEVDLWKKKQ